MSGGDLFQFNRFYDNVLKNRVAGKIVLLPFDTLRSMIYPFTLEVIQNIPIILPFCF